MCADSELVLTICKAVWPIGDRVTGRPTPAFLLPLPPSVFLVAQNSRSWHCLGGVPAASRWLLEGPAAVREGVGSYKQEQLHAGYKISLDSGPQGEGSGVLEI